MPLRDRWRALRARAEAGAFGFRVAWRSGALGALTPSGTIEFVRRARGARTGPHLALPLHACNRPDTVALTDPHRRLTWSALDREVEQLAGGLAALGVGAGDRVAVMLRNGCEFVVAQQAIARLGAIAAQIGYRLKPREIAYILEHAAPAAALFHHDYADFIAEARKLAGAPAPDRLIAVGAPATGTRLGTSYADVIASAPSTPVDATDAANGGVMIYTSGTTGAPKGATRSYRDTGLDAVGDFVLQVGVTAHERHLVVCPLYHSGALAFCSLVFALGGTNVLLEHFDPQLVLETIERERITSAFLVPTMLARLAAADDAMVARYDLGSLRWVVSGAAPLPTETARRFQDRFGRILWNFYGATEIGMVTLAGPDDHAARPGTVGRLLRGNEVALLDADRRPVAVGEVGELYARNPMMIRGYHDDESATREAMNDGFFSVGDLARFDADGFLYLESRASDMIISGGVNIYPREIEDHLVTHPDIVECAVIGIPDEAWGEAVAAVIVARRGARLSADEVGPFCEAALANFKRPRHVMFVDSLPRNPTGKVLKRELRARIAERRT